MLRLPDLLAYVPRAAKRPVHALLGACRVDLHAAPDAPLGYRLVRSHVWGRDYLADLRRLRPTLTTACVVGAYHGATARDLRRVYPAATIYNCEPDPDTFAVLTQSVPVDRVVNVQTAIGDRSGLATLNRHRAPDTNSLLPFEAQAVAETPQLFTRIGDVQVPITTLDGFCEANGIDVIDYLHVDTQGYELRLIKGAAQLLAAQRIDVLLIEVLFAPIYAGQPSYLEVCSELARYGYRLVCLQGLFFQRGHRAPRSGNIIFVRDESAAGEIDATLQLTENL